MQPARLLLSLGLLWGAGFSAQSAHTQARLVLAADAARPGQTVQAGVHLHMDPRWHTYWRNPGASGIPTEIQWQLPAGISAGAIQWPVPEKLPAADLTTYIYKDDVVLLTLLTVPPDARPGPLTLKAKVSWLECSVECIPGRTNLQAILNIGIEATPSKEAPWLVRWQNDLPKSGKEVSPRAWWEKGAAEDMRPLILEWASPRAAREADFFPDGSEHFEVQPDTERLPANAGAIRIRKQVKLLDADWPKDISGLLVQQSGKDKLAYDIKVPIDSSPPAAAATSRPDAAANPGPAPALSLWMSLLYAFIGGLILNVMPCVLPVIALKILGFVAQANDEPRRVRKLGLIYALGVVVSFLALAGLFIGLQAAGHAAAWGIQFSNPIFLVGMTTLLTMIALNLFGAYEVRLSGRVMDSAARLSSGHGAAGAFFNGLLATVLATACTAPYFGAAIGFAFLVRRPLFLLLVLGTAGVGLASPYVILSWQPAWLRFIPKPGRWMEQFKFAMGFPMLAAAAWLFSLIPRFYGERSWWLIIFLVIVALAAWIYGEFAQRGRTGRAAAAVIALALLAGGYAGILEKQLQWRSPTSAARGAPTPSQTVDGIAWQKWSPAAVAAARAAGRPLLVDFTADWCLTCKANKRFAIEVPAVRAKLREINALPLLGDYTLGPDDITEELNRHGRAGVPLVLVYPRNPAAPPIVLPEALTPGIVLKALAAAAP